MAVTTRRAEYAAATRDSLIEEATQLFFRKGFTHTSLAEITASARVTKGALYHHFENKVELFAACFERQAERVAKTVEAVELTDDPWQDTMNQCRAFLNIATDRSLRTVPIQEAITILGWRRWRKLDEQYTMGVLMRGLERLQRESLLKESDINLVAGAVHGILANAMMTLSLSKDKAATQESLLELIENLLSGLLREPRA